MKDPIEHLGNVMKREIGKRLYPGYDIAWDRVYFRDQSGNLIPGLKTRRYQKLELITLEVLSDGIRESLDKYLICTDKGIYEAEVSFKEVH